MIAEIPFPGFIVCNLDAEAGAALAIVDSETKTKGYRPCVDRRRAEVRRGRT